ncbi:MAG TPA: hypothetical protein VIV06_06920, partial [Candidatus Limnocylindrales bacterium]
MTGERAVVAAGGPHGPFETIALQNELLRVIVVPEFGAKVVSLVDRRTGREWLVQGSPQADGAAREAVFGGAAAYGWDECLPTVAPAADPVLPGRRLRDHGDQWGRPCGVDTVDGAIQSRWDGLDWPYRLVRRLSLDGPSVVAEYTLEVDSTIASKALPFLWSMHPLFTLEPGSRIRLPDGVRDVTITNGTGTGIEPGGRIGWPSAARSVAHGDHLALDEVRAAESGQALKLYAGPVERGWTVAETTDGGRLQVSWDTSFARFVGLWLDYGGWPAAPDMPRHEVAIEPTTAPADDLATAIAGGHAERLAGGERR